MPSGRGLRFSAQGAGTDRNPGSGKSTVAVDARDGRRWSAATLRVTIAAPDSPAYQTLVDEGDEHPGAEEPIDRKALSRDVTKTVEELRYSLLIHPVLIETISYRIERFRNPGKPGRWWWTRR